MPWTVIFRKTGHSDSDNYMYSLTDIQHLPRVGDRINYKILSKIYGIVSHVVFDLDEVTITVWVSYV